MSNATMQADGTMAVSGSIRMDVLVHDGVHELSVGQDSFRCLSCDQDHPVGFVGVRDANGGEDVVAIRSAGEAWAVARFLLVEVFGAVEEGSWAALEVMSALDGAERGVQA